MNTRRTLIPSLLLLLSAAAVLPAVNAEERDDNNPAPARRTRLAVCSFDVPPGNPFVRGDLGGSIADQVGARLSKSGRFDLVERGQLTAVSAEWKRVHGGLVDDEGAVNIGKLAHVDLLVYGTVDRYDLSRVDSQKFVVVQTPPPFPGARPGTQTVAVPALKHQASVAVTFKLVDVGTGRIVIQKRLHEDRSVVTDPGQNADYYDLMARALGSTVTGFVDSVGVTNRGMVAAVDQDGKTFVINRGSAQGVKKGDKYRISRNGEEIHDPQTGKVLDYSADKVAEARVVEVNNNTSRLEVKKWLLKSKTTRQITIGDLVESF